MSFALEGDLGNNNIDTLLGATVGQTVPLENNTFESTPFETTPIESTPFETTPIETNSAEINPFGNIPVGSPNAQYNPAGPNGEYVIVGYIEVDQLPEEYKGLTPTVKVVKVKIINQTLNPEIKTKKLEPKDEINKLKPLFPPGTEPFQIANF